MDEIAHERSISPRTVFGHLERIARSDPGFDLGSVMPSPDRTEAIEAALRSNESGFLTPTKEALGDDYSYEEIRLVRLQMERDFEKAEA